MANAMETVRNKGIPALPPLQRVDPVVHMTDEGDGQNRPSASDVSTIGAATTLTPPKNSRARWKRGLSITNAATSSSGNNNNDDQ